jgi:NAD(P)-dependent dehydrogenase (short-subunit alcohol dehydrogenase family)
MINFNLNNKVVVVTGAARGVGLAVATKFLESGASVIFVDVSNTLEDEFKKIINKNSIYSGLALKADISISKEVQYVVNTTMAKFNRIDILVNAAGILYEEYVINFDECNWDKIMNVNAKGVFLCCKYVGKIMVNQRSGKIINISSQQAIKGDIENSVYAASKAAVLRFTQVLAIELADKGIQVNSVCPGIINTDMIKQSCLKSARTKNLNLEKCMETLRNKIPLGRMAEPKDIANLVNFLASDYSDYITGAAILITGGLTCN